MVRGKPDQPPGLRRWQWACSRQAFAKRRILLAQLGDCGREAAQEFRVTLLGSKALLHCSEILVAEIL